MTEQYEEPEVTVNVHFMRDTESAMSKKSMDRDLPSSRAIYQSCSARDEHSSE